MKKHTISIDTKYFEPIRKGQISLLIFNKKILNENEVDYIEAQKGGYSVIAKIEKCYVKSFGEITDEEAREAGFLNKDFLKDELIRRFKIDTLDQLLNHLDEYLFFLVKVSKKDEKSTLFDDLKINIYDTTSELYDIWRYD